MIESLLIWGVLLIGLALVLIVAEAFIPSGGIISLTAAALAVAGVVCMFKVDWRWGVAGTGALLVLGPLAFLFALQLMPSTKVGRQLMFGEGGQERTLSGDEGGSEFDALVGAEGVVMTDLRPVGAVRIGDRRVDALAEIAYIPAGSRVRVTAVEGTTIRVRAV